jgi:Domain of unknown function (DUF1707)
LLHDPLRRDPARLIQGGLEIPGAGILANRERACDADRNRYIDHLAESHRLGYIGADAFRARMTAAAEAVTLDELARLLADLRPLPPPRPPLRSRLGQPTARRWLHIQAIPAALFTTIAGPVLVYALTGYTVTYGTGHQAAQAVQHSGPAIAAMFLLVFLGLAGLFADVFWWVRREDDLDRR